MRVSHPCRLEERAENWRIRPDSNRHNLDRQSSALAFMLRIPWVREPDLNRRLRFMRPADCHFPIPRQNWCMWKDSNLRCSPLWVTALQAAAVAAGPHMHGGAQLSRTVIPRRSLRVQAGSPHRWRYAPIQKLVVGAGLEPAHASRREPRLQRGAMPFRSSYRYKHLAETIRFERMVPFKDTPR